MTPSFHDPVVLTPAHAAPTPSQQAFSGGLSTDFLSQYRQLKSQISTTKNEPSSRDRDLKLKYKLAEIDAETESFRSQM